MVLASGNAAGLHPDVFSVNCYMKSFLIIVALFFSVPALSQDNGIEAEIQETLTAFNLFRKAAGLNPVKLSIKISEGCNAHARYLVLNKDREQTAGLKAHEEFEGLPGYSLAGQVAGRRSVIAFEKPSSAVTAWINSFYHRIPLLQPSVMEIGIGYATDGVYGVALLECMDESNSTAVPDVVFYPAPGQENVPTTFTRIEIPDPVPASDTAAAVGFPITIFFSAFQKIERAEFILTDKTNKVIRCYISSPEHPATFFSQWNTVCAIPVQPLMKNSKYFVSVKCKVNGKPYKKAYSFTTLK